MPEITELLYVSRTPAWAPWAVQYFFLIGLSYGSFVLSLPGLAFGIEGWRRYGRAALLGALVCGLVAPFALLADINQPGRFVNAYLHPAATSWMAWGAFFIPAYLGGLLLYAWAAMAPDFAAAARDGGPLAPVRRLLSAPARPTLVLALGLFTLVTAFAVSLYTGAELMVVAARPLWATKLLPWLLATTALLGSIGLTMILARFACGDGTAADRLGNRLLLATTALVVVLAAAWFALAALDPQSAEGRTLAQVSGSAVWRIAALRLAAVVAITTAVALFVPVGTGWATGLFTLATAWMFRWMIFMNGQELPKTGAGIQHHPLALGPDGLLGIVGSAGLWIAVLAVLTTLLPWSGTIASRDTSTAALGA